jgi:hypothetical protein
MKSKRFSISISGPTTKRDIVTQLTRFEEFGEPDWVEINSVDSSRKLWQKHVLAAENFAVVWNGGEAQMSYSDRTDMLVVAFPGAFDDASHALKIATNFQFELAALGSTFKNEWIAADYPRWGFGRSHLLHGWGCAFRGAGHDRLVSRRWLDFGPWRVLRRPDDTTFIQFHDLDITDPAEAYAQAAPGHERMGNSATGGYLQHNLDWIIGEVKGLYVEQHRTLEMVVGPRIEVSQEDMLSLCALRLQHRLEPPASNRIDHVAYIFTDRADAEAHLHEIWLRELQCWYIDGHGKHRLDADYHPVPNPPAWVKKPDGT